MRRSPDSLEFLLSTQQLSTAARIVGGTRFAPHANGSVDLSPAIVDAAPGAFVLLFSGALPGQPRKLELCLLVNVTQCPPGFGVGRAGGFRSCLPCAQGFVNEGASVEVCHSCELCSPLHLSLNPFDHLGLPAFRSLWAVRCSGCTRLFALPIRRRDLQRFGLGKAERILRLR